MWAWQGANQTSDSGAGTAGPAGHPGTGTNPGPGPNPGQQQQQQQQPQELSEMLQMLDQGGTTSFEDLNMFTTTFE